jgi:hypothetical protein
VSAHDMRLEETRARRREPLVLSPFANLETRRVIGGPGRSPISAEFCSGMTRVRRRRRRYGHEAFADRLTRAGQQPVRCCRSHSPSRRPTEHSNLFPVGRFPQVNPERNHRGAGLPVRAAAAADLTWHERDCRLAGEAGVGLDVIVALDALAWDELGQRAVVRRGRLLRLAKGSAAAARHKCFPNRAGAERTSAMATLRRFTGNAVRTITVARSRSLLSARSSGTRRCFATRGAVPPGAADSWFVAA